MIEVTESAKKQLEDYFKDKEPSPVRVYLASGGCSGTRLTLALDEKGDKDAEFESGGFSFVIDKELLELTGNVRIDMTYYGFTVESDNPVGGGGCSCGCSSSDGGGGCSSGGCSC